MEKVDKLPSYSATVIGFCNSKGGPGKTTLALNSTIELFDQGRKVAFIDAEEGGVNGLALSKYEPRIQVRAASTAFDIDDAIEELSLEHEVIFLDSPGKSTGEEVSTICSLANLVIVPMKTSRKDIRQTQPVLRMIRRCQENQGGRPESVIVFNETRERSASARAYRKQLTEKGYQVARAEIRLYEYHKSCEFVTRDPDKDPQRNSHKCAEDIWKFVYEVIQPRLSIPTRAANE